MNKTKIEWATMTWNPITGCLHDCTYCYARKIAERFGSVLKEDIEEHRNQQIHVVDRKKHCPYPFVFEPTFHRYRLDEPSKKTKGQNIFVCSMADLFGEWVPDEWIKEVFRVCEAAPQHNYLFLTKNPERYVNTELPIAKNFWYGSTLTDMNSEFVCKHDDSKGNYFLSIEPILEKVYIHSLNKIDWIIIGAETGNRKGKVIPEKSWIDNIVEQCKAVDVQVFMKDSLIPVMGEENMLREFPKELRK